MSRKPQAHSKKRVTVTGRERERDAKLPAVRDRQRFDQLLDDAIFGVAGKTPKQRK
jgi:hypothetical protein